MDPAKIQELEGRLGHTFKERKKLYRALTHSTFSKEEKERKIGARNCPHLATYATLGDANLREDSEKYILAEKIGRSLIDHGFRLITGGLGGVMEAASKGARSSSHYTKGDIIGILPGNDPSDANPYVDICIPTGLDLARNVIVANADAVITIGGGAGTLAEMANAWALGRLIIAYRVEG